MANGLVPQYTQPFPIKVPELIEPSETVPEESKRLETEWQERVQKRNELLYQDYLKTHSVSPLLKHSTVNISTLANLQKTASGTSASSPIHRSDAMQQLRDFEKWYTEEEKNRVDELPPELREVEIRLGGVNSENLWAHALTDSLNQSLTLGLAGGSHPIYGKHHREIYKSANMAGAILGETASFISLAGMGKAVGIPQLISRMATSSKTAGTVVRSVGHIGSTLGTFKRIVPFSAELSNAIRIAPAVVRGATAKAGEAAIQSAIRMGSETALRGLVVSTSEVVKGSVAKYLREDQMTEEEYYKNASIAQLAGLGFLKGMGMHLINAPGSWHWRLFLDATYSSGTQLSRMALGLQNGFDWGSFGVDFVVGNIMGESDTFLRYAGQKLKDTSFKMQAIKEVSKSLPDTVNVQETMRQNMTLIETVAKKNNVSIRTEDVVSGAMEIMSAEGQKVQHDNLPFTPEQKAVVADFVVQKHEVLNTSKEAFRNPDNFRIDRDNINKTKFELNEQSARDMAVYFKWGKNDVETAIRSGAIDSPEALIAHLKQKDMIRATSPTKKDIRNVPGIGFDTFADEMKNVADEISLRYKGTVLEGRQMRESQQFAEIAANRALFNEFIPSKDYYQNVLANKAKKLSIDFDALETKNKVLDYFFEPDVYEKIITRMQAVLEKDTKLSSSFSPQDMASEVYAVMERRGNDFYIRNKSVSPDELYQNAVIYVEKLAANRNGIFAKTNGKTPNDYASDFKNRVIRGEMKQKSIDTGDVNNVDFNLMLYHARRSPDGFVGASIRYLRDVLDMADSEIQAHLAKFGIKKTLTAIRSAGDAVMKKSNVSKLVNAYLKKNVPIKRYYTPKDVETIYNNLVTHYAKANALTGLDTDISSHVFAGHVKQSGAFVLSVRDFHNKLMQEYGMDVANNAVVAVSKVMNDYVQKRNIDFVHRKFPGRVILKNPVENNSSVFVFSATKIGEKEFKESIIDLYNILARRYEDVSQNSVRQFSLTIDRDSDPRTADVIEKIDNIDISYVKNVDDLNGIVNKFDVVQRIANAISPEMGNKFFRTVLNYSDERVQKAVNRIYEIAATRDINEVLLSAQRSTIDEELATIDKLTDEVTVDQPETSYADAKYNANAALGDDIHRINQEKASYRNMTQGEALEETVYKTAKESNDDSDYMKSVMDGEKDAFEWMMRIAEDNSAQIELERKKLLMEREGFLTRTLHKATDSLKKITTWGKESTDIYGANRERYDGTFKKILQTASEKTEARQSVVTDMINENYRDIDEKYFHSQTLSRKQNAGNRQVFMNLKMLLREKEFKSFYSDYASYREKVDIEKTLMEPIQWDKDFSFDLHTFLKNPAKMSSVDIVNLRRASKDDFVYSKILVQHLGISPRDLIDFFKIDDKVFYKTIEKHFADVGSDLGYFLNAPLFDKARRAQMGDVQATIKQFLPDTDIDKLNFYTEEGHHEIAYLIAQVAQLSPADGERIRLRMKQFVSWDPNKVSYVTHLVLSGPEGKELFRKEMLTDLNPFEQGRREGDAPIGTSKKTANPVIDELYGRKVNTFEDLAEGGYSFVFDAYQTEHALLSYILSKKALLNFAENMRNTFFAKFSPRYASLKAELDSFTLLLKDKNAAMKDIGDSVEKIRQYHDEVAGVLDDTGGISILPSLESEHRYKKIIKGAEDVLSRKQELNLSGEVIDIYERKLASAAASLQQQKDLLDFYSGRQLMNAELTLIKRFAKTDESTPEKIDLMKKNAREQLMMFKGRVASKIFFDADNEIMPFRRHGHVFDLESARGGESKDRIVDPKTGKSRRKMSVYNIRHILLPMKMKIGRNRLEAPDLPGFDGIYAHRSVHAVMKQFINRSDYLRETDSYAGKNIVKRAITNTNGFLKTVGLWKATIMIGNDMGQTMMQTNVFSRTYGRALKQAPKVISERFDPASKHGKLYWYFDQENLYNRDMGLSPLIKDWQLSLMRLIGEDKNLGIRYQLEQILRNSVDEFGKVRDEKDIPGKVTAILQGTLKTSGDVLRSIQEVSWNADQFIRTATALDHTDRYYPIELKRAQMQKPNATREEIEATALKNAARQAARRTNLYLVEYGRMPAESRQFANLFIRYPTFRVGTMRMYKDIVASFFKGFDTLRKGVNIASERPIVSENRLMQAMYEMGPLLRNIITKQAIRGAMAAFLGYEYADLMDRIGGYRMQKVVNKNDPLTKTMQFISLSTPFFAMEKYFTRSRKNFDFLLRSEIAALPGLVWMMKSNRDIIGKPLWKTPWTENPAKSTAELAISIFKNYFPIGTDYNNWADRDLTLFQKLLNTSGIAFFYSIDSPEQLMRDYYAAIDKSKSPADHEKAMRQFNSGLSYVSQTLFNEEFGDRLEEIRSQLKIYPQ